MATINFESYGNYNLRTALAYERITQGGTEYMQITVLYQAYAKASGLATMTVSGSVVVTERTGTEHTITIASEEFGGLNTGYWANITTSYTVLLPVIDCKDAYTVSATIRLYSVPYSRYLYSDTTDTVKFIEETIITNSSNISDVTADGEGTQLRAEFGDTITVEWMPIWPTPTNDDYYQIIIMFTYTDRPYEYYTLVDHLAYTDAGYQQVTIPLSYINYMYDSSATSILTTMYVYNREASGSFRSRGYVSVILSVPDSAAPTGTITVSEGAEDLPQDIDVYVQKFSKFTVGVDATLRYGARLQSIKTTVSGSTYSGSSFTSNRITASGNVTLTSKITDSRGKVGTVTRTVYVYPYSAPTITGADVYRVGAYGSNVENRNGEYGCVIPYGSVSPVNNENTYSVTVYYRATNSSNYSTAPITTASGDYTLDGEYCTFAADAGSSYDLYVVVEDLFTSTRYYCSPLGATGALIFIKDNRKGMGIFQMIPNNEDGIWINGDTHITGKQYETATLTSGESDTDLPNSAFRQYSVTESGSGLYAPLFSVRTDTAILTLCVDTANNKFGMQKVNLSDNSVSFTAF